MIYILRVIFWALDGILGVLVRFLYNLIFDIASARILQNYIWEFAGRIYTFLAIFMLFKLSISVVNYILNPDQLTDKSKGFGKLIQNVIIVIGLIIMVPTIFDWAYKLQCLVLNSGVLNTIITGVPNAMNTDQLTKSCFGGEDQCINLTNSKKEAGYMLTYSIFSGFVYQKSGDEDSIAEPANTEEPPSAKSGIGGHDTCEEFVKTEGYAKANDCIFNFKTVTKTKENEYLIFVSTACLGFIAYVFLGFALDIAIRSVKLCFLQLIAPVPIISMLDPNSGKSGMFSKWLKECTKTYGDLFIRLGAVYFAVEIISQLFQDGLKDYYGCNIPFFAKIFLCLGVLAFAKQLPQFIESITGIKMSGDGLSLKKKFGNVPGLGRAAAATVGIGGSMVANAMAAKKNFKGQGWKGFGKGVGSTIAGGLSGGFRGLTSKEKSPWKAGQAGVKGSVNARNLRDQRELNGEKSLGQKIKGGLDRTYSKAENWAGIQSGSAKFDKEISAYDGFLKKQSELDSYIESEIMKRKGRTNTHFDWTNTNGVAMHSNGNVNVLKQQAESLKASGANAIDIENAERAYNAALKQSKIDYFDDHKTDNVIIKNTTSEMNYIVSSNSDYSGFAGINIDSGDSFDKSKGTIKEATSNLQASDDYRKAQINKTNKSQN